MGGEGHGLTKREMDGGVSVAFSIIFQPLGFLGAQVESTAGSPALTQTSR